MKYLPYIIFAAVIGVLLQASTHVTVSETRYGSTSFSPGNPARTNVFDVPFPDGTEYDVFVELNTDVAAAVTFPITDKTVNGFVIRIAGNPNNADLRWRALAR